MPKPVSYVLTAAVAAMAITVASGAAQAEKLPKTLNWTAYDVGSSGYSQSVAVGSALKNKRGINLRVLPGKNDVSRTAPLRDGKVQFTAHGIGAVFALEAVFTFGVPEWGPQQLRMLSMSNSDACQGLIVAGDIGVKSYADLKGKRLARVKAAPALNHNVYTFLQFAGLDWKDVKEVEFGGYGDSMNGVIDNQHDGAVTITTSGFALKIMSSPRGGMYPPVPHNDAEGWKRLLNASPWFFKKKCTDGAGIKTPFEGAAYPYPVLVAYDTQDAELVYEMTKAMFELYEDYKDAAPGAYGWALDRQVLDWELPLHKGAVRYYQEIGKWNAAHQASLDKKLQRAAVVANAWKAYMAKAPKDDKDAFTKGWMEARASALEAAGLNPVFRTW